MESAALKAMREHKPVYCFGRRYEIIGTKHISYYLIFIIKPVGVGSTLRKTIEVSSSSLTTSKNYWDYLNDAK